MLPHYKREGKASWSLRLDVQADSIVPLHLAEYIGQFFQNDYQDHISHRDIERRKEKTT